jgi:predicted DNA repair protein MutK
LISALPKVIKALAFIGTIVLLLVSGGIFAHNIPFFIILSSLPDTLREFIFGLIGGIIALALVLYLKSFKKNNNHCMH